MNFFLNFYQIIKTCVHQGAKDQQWPELSLDKLTLEPPKDISHGDLSTNAALILSKQVGKKSQEIAEILKPYLEKACPSGTIITVAGPGFLNMTLPHAFWIEQLSLMLKKDHFYGPTQVGAGKKVHIEFVSANPTGPMHTGHSRNAVLGDSIASTLEAVGYNVHREYYVNDAGNQVDTLARSIYLRYLQLHGHDIPANAFEGLYPGDYVIDLAKTLQLNKGDVWVNQDETQWLTEIRDFAIEEVMKGVKQDLHDLGITMDQYISEKALAQEGRVDHVVDVLKAKDDLYEGVLEAPKGHVIEDFESRPQTLFRATHYGDTVDRAIKKSDGTWTYFTPDIANHLYKYERGFDDLIDIFGADHSGYIVRIKAAVKAVTHNKASLQVLTCQMVNFMDNGQPVRMSKRSGTFITLRDLIDEVGKDAIRFMMLTRHPDVGIDFDFAKVKEHSKDNPIFYVQYAHARICSVLRHAKILWSDFEENMDRVDLSVLNDPDEIRLVKILAQYPRTVELAAQHREPHRIAYYLYDVASHFHSLWNKGKEHTHLRFIDEKNEKMTQARLGLLLSCKQIIAHGLKIFKIDPMEEMRS